MSVEDNVEESTEVAEVATEVSEEKSEITIDPTKGEKFDRVEFTPEQQMRFNRMYAQVKKNEAVNRQLIEDNRKLLDKVMQIESQTVDKEITDAMSKLRAEKQRAYENGDVKALDRLDEEIYDLKEKQKKFKEEEKSIKKDLETPALDPELTSRVVEWSKETDTEGKLLRPFVNPNHKDHAKFLRITDFVLTDPEMQGKTEDDMFEAVDKALKSYGLLREDNKVSSSKKPIIPSMLTGDSETRGKASGTVSLTNEQRYVAKKMFPKSKDPEREYALALKDLGKK
jgi:hypothetical protein